MVTKASLGVLDPAVLDRDNHFGTQAISTIDGLAAALAAVDVAQTKGTWTPRFFGGTTAGTPTYSSREGTYLRVGDLVYATVYLVITNFGGAAGQVRIDDLPFAGPSGVPNRTLFMPSFWAGFNLPAGTIGWKGFLQSGITIFMYRDTLTAGTTNLLVSELTATTTIYGTIVYEAVPL